MMSILAAFVLHAPGSIRALRWRTPLAQLSQSVLACRWAGVHTSAMADVTRPTAIRDRSILRRALMGIDRR
jgi:hypothetical protein